MVSGAVVISVQATTARAANLLASFIIVPMALLLVGESMVMFWANYRVLWLAIFGQIIITGLLIRTGTAYFNREDLLGREFDTMGIRRSLRIFIETFKGSASSFPAWYWGIVRQVFTKMWIPILIIFLVIVIGGFIGSDQASVFVLPPEVIDFTNVSEGFILDLEEYEPFQFFSVRGVGSVWFHNLRAITIATFLGLFTFGVFGLLVLMLPFVLIGYITATVAGAGVSPGIFLLAFIMPHGILEIPAILIAGAAILQLGATLTTPAKGITMGEALVCSFADWSRVMVGLVMPLFLVSAILEMYLTPLVVNLFFGQ
jgi:uncharacterized membrane protein SpoIIM required for sporulation